MATIDLALDLLFGGERAECSTTAAVADAMASGVVTEVTCDTCNGRGVLVGGVWKVRRRGCEACHQTGKRQISVPHMPTAGAHARLLTHAHADCTSRRFRAGKYPTLKEPRDSSPRGCVGCGFRGYITGLDVQPKGGPPESMSSTELEDFDPRWPLQRWLRSLPPRTREAVEAWHSPAAVQWRAELAADRKMYRNANQPLPPDCDRTLNLAPLMPLCSAARAAHRTTPGVARNALAEIAIRQATELLDLVKTAERKYALTLRYSLTLDRVNTGSEPRLTCGVYCSTKIGGADVAT